MLSEFFLGLYEDINAVVNDFARNLSGEGVIHRREDLQGKKISDAFSE